MTNATRRIGDRSARRTRRAAGCVLVLVAGSLLTACDGASDAEQSLSRASERLALIETAGDSGEAGSSARKSLAEVRASLEEVKSSGLPGEAAAANLMIAQTHLGEAVLDGHQMGDLFDRAALRQSALQSELALWRGVKRDAASAAAFNAAERRSAANDLLTKAAEEKTQLEQERAEVNRQINELVARRDALQAEVETLRRERGQFELSIPTTPSPERLARVRQARLQERHEQAVEYAITGLNAQIEALEPEVGRLTSEIAQRDREQEIVRGVLAEIDAQERAAREAADAKNARARELAGNLRARLFGGTITELRMIPREGEDAPIEFEREQQDVEGLHPLRTGPLAESIEKTASSYERARQAAQAASSKLGQQARSTMDRASSGLAQLHGRVWESRWAYVSLLEDLRSVESLASSSDFTDALKAARIAEMESLVAFAEAAGESAETVRAQAQAALTALQTTPFSPNVFEDARTKARAALRQAEDAMAADAAARAADRDAGGGDGFASGGGGSGDPALDQAINAFLDAVRNGQLQSSLDLMAFDNDQQRQLFATAAPMADAMLQLEIACQQQFGQSLSEATGGVMMGGEAPDFATLASMNASDLRINIEGDRATAVLPAEPGDPMELVNRDGRWLVDLGPQMREQVASTSPQEVQMMQSMMPMLTQMFSGLTQRVRAGEFSSIDEVAQALATGMMGGGPG